MIPGPAPHGGAYHRVRPKKALLWHIAGRWHQLADEARRSRHAAHWWRLDELDGEHRRLHGLDAFERRLHGES